MICRDAHNGEHRGISLFIVLAAVFLYKKAQNHIEIIRRVCYNLVYIKIDCYMK